MTVLQLDMPVLAGWSETDPPKPVPTPFDLIPREVVWPGKDPTNYYGGTRRPLLAPNRPYLTVHYTGAGYWADFGDTIPEARSIELWASSSTKRTPWEYNWIIDTEGSVVEYAGFYQAAHSAGENSLAIGVLLLLGPSEAPSLAMIETFRKLRWWLQQVLSLSPSHVMLGHYQMPGASTPCPGPRVLAVWNVLAQPWWPPPPSGINYGSEANVGLFMAQPPVPILDTRNGPSKILADGKWFTVTVPGLPADADAAIFTLTTDQADGNGYVETADPRFGGVTDLNFRADRPSSNTTICGVSGGQFRIKVHGAATHVIIGYKGYVT